jgi:hypothetical protein
MLESKDSPHLALSRQQEQDRRHKEILGTESKEFRFTVLGSILLVFDGTVVGKSGKSVALLNRTPRARA